MPVVIKPAAISLTAIIEAAEGQFVAYCPELDLATAGDSVEEALDDLVEMAVEYAQLYIDELALYSNSPNRATHRPYIQAIASRSFDRGEVRKLFEQEA